MPTDFPIKPSAPKPEAPQSQPEDVSFQIMPSDGLSGNETMTTRQPSTVSTPLPVEEESHTFHSKGVYIVIGLLVVAAAGAAAYFLLGNVTPETKTAESQLPKTWLKQYFNVEVCDNASTCGDAADPDNDGLTNYEEFKVRKGTDPHNKDTDSDGLADGDESHIYKTEPAVKFSSCINNTGISCQFDDGSQIANDYDPLTPGVKTTETRKKQIADDTEKFKLHEPTPTTLQKLRTSNTTAQPQTYTVTIENGKFNPDTVNLKVGDSVLWVNKDTKKHTVSSLTLQTLLSPELSTNMTFSYQFTKAGTYNYVDKDAPTIKGTVIVKWTT